jgi:hypothetical protein
MVGKAVLLPTPSGAQALAVAGRHPAESCAARRECPTLYTR